MNKPVVKQSVSFSFGYFGSEPKEPVGPALPKPTHEVLPSHPGQMSRKDREFLAHAIAILETPPSPVAIAMIFSICALFLSTLGWSYFGMIDIYAIAPGKIQPSGRSKVVQPLEPGKVVAVFVENGSYAQAGDVLIELDPTETAADEEGLRRDFEASAAEALRRRIAIEAARLDHQMPSIEFPSGVSPSVRQRELDVLTADLGQLRANMESYRAQAAQARATIRRLTESVTAREKVIALTRERADMRELVDKRGAGSRAQIIDALERYENQVTTQVGEQGQLRESQAVLETIEKKMGETVAQFIADQSQKLAEAERKRDRVSEDLIKAHS